MDELPFRHRGRDVADRAREILDELIKLEAETQPAAGTTSEARKHVRARQALQLVDELVDRVAGWAVDHAVGVAADSDVPTYKEEASTYTGKRPLSSFDAHQVEAVGSSYGFDQPAASRRVLQQLLSYGAPIPPKLRQVLMDAINNLEAGHIEPIFQRRRPEGGKRGSSYRVQLCRLRALEHLSFRVGRGQVREHAKQEIADAYGVAPASVENWWRRLPEFFGAHGFSTAVNLAEQHGNVIRAFGGAPSEEAATFIRSMEDQYGAPALALDGAEHRRAQRSDEPANEP